MTNKKEIRELFLLQISKNLGKSIDKADQVVIDSGLVAKSEIRELLGISSAPLSERANHFNYTPKAPPELLSAIDKEKFDIVKKLLNNGADSSCLVNNPWILNKIKNQIVFHSDIELAELLAKSGFNLNKEGEDGTTFYNQLKSMVSQLFAEHEVPNEVVKAYQLFDQRKTIL